MAHEMHQTCIDACNECADACDHCAAACLKEQDVKMMAQCVALDMDCAALCRLAAGFMPRGSPFAKEVCRMCAMVCAELWVLVYLSRYFRASLFFYSDSSSDETTASSTEDDTTSDEPSEPTGPALSSPDALKLIRRKTTVTTRPVRLMKTAVSSA